MDSMLWQYRTQKTQKVKESIVIIVPGIVL